MPRPARLRKRNDQFSVPPLTSVTRGLSCLTFFTPGVILTISATSLSLLSVNKPTRLSTNESSFIFTTWYDCGIVNPWVPANSTLLLNILCNSGWKLSMILLLVRLTIAVPNGVMSVWFSSGL